MIIFAIVLFALGIFLGYLFCLGGRTDHPGMDMLRKWRYAHRGLHNATMPENSMAAFRAALNAGFGIELDVHLMKDGNLAVIHDSSLLRTAGADVRIEDLTVEELDAYRLEQSAEKIPLFRDVLALYAGKAPLIVELKCDNGNHAALCEAACNMLDSYRGPFCVESFDPRAVIWMRKNRPNYIRGQLSENWMQKKIPVHSVLKFAMTYHISNLVSRPDFIAYKFCDRKVFGTDLCRKVMGLQGVAWTLKSQEEFDIACLEGWIPIFEGFQP